MECFAGMQPAAENKGLHMAHPELKSLPSGLHNSYHFAYQFTMPHINPLSWSWHRSSYLQQNPWPTHFCSTSGVHTKAPQMCTSKLVNPWFLTPLHRHAQSSASSTQQQHLQSTPQNPQSRKDWQYPAHTLWTSPIVTPTSRLNVILLPSEVKTCKWPTTGCCGFWVQVR